MYMSDYLLLVHLLCIQLPHMSYFTGREITCLLLPPEPVSLSRKTPHRSFQINASMHLTEKTGIPRHTVGHTEMKLFLVKSYAL